MPRNGQGGGIQVISLLFYKAKLLKLVQTTKYMPFGCVSSRLWSAERKQRRGGESAVCGEEEAACGACPFSWVSEDSVRYLRCCVPTPSRLSSFLFLLAYQPAACLWNPTRPTFFVSSHSLAAAVAASRSTVAACWIASAALLDDGAPSILGSGTPRGIHNPRRHPYNSTALGRFVSSTEIP